MARKTKSVAKAPGKAAKRGAVEPEGQGRPKCADLVQSRFEGRIKAITEMLEAEYEGETHPEHGPFNEYGLSFDYVTPGTFNDQKRGYWRYQISWGGPSDEFRFYGDSGGRGRIHIDRAEYWYLDWWDGASVDVTNDPRVIDLWGQLEDMAESIRDEAMEDYDESHEAGADE